MADIKSHIAATSSQSKSLAYERKHEEDESDCTRRLQPNSRKGLLSKMHTAEEGTWVWDTILANFCS